MHICTNINNTTVTLSYRLNATCIGQRITYPTICFHATTHVCIKAVSSRKAKRNKKKKNIELTRSSFRQRFIVVLLIPAVVELFATHYKIENTREFRKKKSHTPLWLLLNHLCVCVCDVVWYR